MYQRRQHLFHSPLLMHRSPEWRWTHWFLASFPWVFTSSTITFALLFQCQQTENMEKAKKLRPAQSFPSLCHSPRSNPELRAVLLRKAVSVSELVARCVFSLWLQFTSDLRGSGENSPSPTSVTNRSHSDKIFPKHSIPNCRVSSERWVFSATSAPICYRFPVHDYVLEDKSWFKIQTHSTIFTK